MCLDQQRFLLPEEFIPSRARSAQENAVVEALRDRLAETEARLERARAREAELNRRLEEMKRFISVMEILETYLKRRFRERQAQLSSRILSFRVSLSSSIVNIQNSDDETATFSVTASFGGNVAFNITCTSLLMQDTVNGILVVGRSFGLEQPWTMSLNEEEMGFGMGDKRLVLEDKLWARSLLEVLVWFQLKVLLRLSWFGRELRRCLWLSWLLG
uniref:Protein SKIP34 n=1 Tax=Nelumbo nucifera TaxID=4432 RepID=A0A822ZD31_NELNU|nr:TPA_asm: hypothetical protein HUJ06_015259 [Nelumbo nucifera]